MTPLRVIGVGNTARGDDGVGPAVVERLAAMDLPGVTLLCRDGEGTALMAAWDGAQRVYLVDAMRSGCVAGSVHRLDAARETVPADVFHYSSHAFGLAEAVELARALGELPPTTVIYGVTGADFGAGDRLSAPVSMALEALTERLAGELRDA